MAEWIYFIHPPRDDFAETMTEAESDAWSRHGRDLEAHAGRRGGHCRFPDRGVKKLLASITRLELLEH